MTCLGELELLEESKLCLFLAQILLQLGNDLVRVNSALVLCLARLYIITHLLRLINITPFSYKNEMGFEWDII